MDTCRVCSNIYNSFGVGRLMLASSWNLEWGKRLRAERERLGLSLRDVETLSHGCAIRIWRQREPANIPPGSPWAQRMIQLQLALLYFVSFLQKMRGAPWLQGTALFYVYHLNELRRFPLPSWFFHPVVLNLVSWSALALEFSLGILIWVKEFRYFLLALGLLFHFWLEYSLHIPLFQWDVLSAYILFVEPADISRAWDWIKRPWG